jgi:hypothetical protein
MFTQQIKLYNIKFIHTFDANLLGPFGSILDKRLFTATCIGVATN